MTQIDQSSLRQVYIVSIVYSVVASCLNALFLRISIVLASKAVSGTWPHSPEYAVRPFSTSVTVELGTSSAICCGI